MFALAALGVLAGAALAAPGDISTVAGTGTAGFSGDGGPATAAWLRNPVGIAPTADGGFLLTDTENHRIRKVSAGGTITTVAGDGTACAPTTATCGDGGPATSAQLNRPLGVATTADGGFLIVDSNDHRIRKVSPTGMITTVAGIGSAGFSGDGGPATSAELTQPRDVAPTADGGFLIAGGTSPTVRKVSAGGTITTVAGSGTSAGFSGDGGAATAATLNVPNGVALTADGGFLIGDTGNQRVRKVSATGTITTVAGNGTACSPTTASCGDGGLATAAQLNSPGRVATTTDGGYLIADSLNNRIRKVSATGTVTTVAGDGTACSPTTDPCGDAGPATSAQLNLPTGVVSTADGGFLIADPSNNRIRKVEGAAPPPQGKISARGAVHTAQGPTIGFSAVNDCNAAQSTRPSIVGTTGGSRIWTKTAVTQSSCTDAPPASPLGFDTQTGTATGTFGPSAPGGRNGQQGTLQWTYYDNSPDTVQFTLRDSSNNVVFQAATQTPAPYLGSPGGVWTSGP